MAAVSDDDVSMKPAAQAPPKIVDEAVGGKRPGKSFALLDGFFDDPDQQEEKKERFTIDITRLPAVLGRSNESDKDNPHFFGLGKKKALSRKHCTIYYRDREGGHAEYDETKQETVYKDAKQMMREHGAHVASKKAPKPNPHLVPDESSENGLPPKGFFVMECLGKNRILVDRTRVEQGESIVLRSGSAIRISNYKLYFLLPTDAEPKPHQIELPPDEKAKAPKKAKSTTTAKAKGSSASKDATAKKEASSTKKEASTTTKKRPVPTIAPSAAKKSKTSTTLTLSELEALPVEELLEKMDQAVSKGLWDRRNQFIGATICYHAVRSAGSDLGIQEKVVNGGGVSRSDIMEWIEKSEKFGSWVRQMLANMEPRSYQAAITKSLLKNGFTRTSGAGRYIKWELPDDIPLRVQKKKRIRTERPSIAPPVDTSHKGNDETTDKTSEGNAKEKDENEKETTTTQTKEDDNEEEEQSVTSKKVDDEEKEDEEEESAQNQMGEEDTGEKSDANEEEESMKEGESEEKSVEDDEGEAVQGEPPASEAELTF